MDSANGMYLYAIAEHAGERSYDVPGIAGSAVHALGNGRVAAVVSEIPAARIRPERRHLAAHQAVMRRLMADSTVLPMVFGVIASGPEGVRQILSLNERAFAQQLDRVAGKVEMSLHVRWDVPDIFEHFVRVHPELRAARDQLLVHSQQIAREDKIELGQMFERYLQEDRAAYTEGVERVLSRCCFEIKRDRPRNEQEVMHLACLVGRDAGAEFEASILEAARLFDDNFVFDYNGPWAPHHFVELELKLPSQFREVQGVRR